MHDFFILFFSYFWGRLSMFFNIFYYYFGIEMFLDLKKKKKIDYAFVF